MLSTIEQMRAIVAAKTAAEIDGVLVDMFTASAVIQVHDALNEANRASFAAQPLLRMVALTWRLVERTTGGAK